MSKVKHIALLKFKEGTPADQIDKIFAEIMDMTEAIPGIEDYVAGANCSAEGLSQGFTHGFIMTFSDAMARDTYVSHPEHVRVKSMLLPLVESVAVFDFEV